MFITLFVIKLLYVIQNISKIYYVIQFTPMSKASGSLIPCKIFLKNNKFFFLSAWIHYFILFLFFPNL